MLSLVGFKGNRFQLDICSQFCRGQPRKWKLLLMPPELIFWMGALKGFLNNGGALDGFHKQPQYARYPLIGSLGS